MANEYNQGGNNPRPKNSRGRAQNPQSANINRQQAQQGQVQKYNSGSRQQPKQVYKDSGAQRPEPAQQAKTKRSPQAEAAYKQRIAQQQSANTIANGNLNAAQGRTTGKVKTESAVFTAASGTGNAVAKTKVKKKKSKGFTVVIAVILIILIVLGVFILSAFNIIDGKISGANTGHGKIVQKHEQLPEYKGKKIVNILVCGIDYDEGASSYSDSENRIGRTDMIMYVHYDTVANKANVLQVPRDTFVGENVRTGGNYKINGLFYSAEDKDNRMQALADVFYDQFKLPVDHYVTIDLDSMKELVAVVGNINVYVPYDISDPNYGITLEEGWRVLDPDTAEFFVRNRNSPNYNQKGDIMRMQTQLNFYSALFRLMKTMPPNELVDWGKILIHYVKTDMKSTDILGLLLKVLKIEGEDITLVRMPCGPASYKGQSILVWEAEESAELLNQYFRPEGLSYTAAELDIQQVPLNMGIHEASIKNMASIEQDAPPMPDDFNW